MTRSSRRRTAAPAFPALSPGIQTGLQRLVSDNAATVAEMLSKQDDVDNTEVLCEACAGVMKQQQLSAASLLARFFDATVLAEHAVLLQKSGKGSAPTLSERIANEWAKNKGIPEAEEGGNEPSQTEESKTKRKKTAEEDKDETPKKKKKKSDKTNENDTTPDKKEKK
jgi:replication initiation and membrane attachment protein DnaB